MIRPDSRRTLRNNYEYCIQYEYYTVRQYKSGTENTEIVKTDIGYGMFFYCLYMVLVYGSRCDRQM